MSFDPQEINKLENVCEMILKQINDAAVAIQDRRKDLRDAHKEIWAETPIIRNMDDAMNLVTLSSEIAQHERQYASAHHRLGQLKNMLGSPYFARIDFTEDGYDDLEEIYIGKHSLFDGQVFHVYDWRAPISSLYYDHGVGKASFTVTAEGVSNEISGEITLKRQYSIVAGEMVFLFDSELTIEDDILQVELSRASDAKVKTIIHTIQREQNKAIRSDADQLLVFGPAGSGKTSVGLHRLAYLLYKHRGNLTSGKVRIFSPSPIFASYIEGIIPELGEEDVQSLDFPALLSGYGSYDPYEQIDFLQTASPNDPRRIWLAEKLSPTFVNFLEAYVRGHKPSLDEDIYFNRDMICPKERLAELYRDRTSAGNLSSKTARVIEYVSRAHEEYFANNKKSITEFFSRLQDENLSDGAIRHRFDEQKNIVLADLRNRLLPHAKRLYERALRAWVKQSKQNLPNANKALASLRWEKPLYEDALILYFINLLTGKTAKDNLAQHILLDEAQDISHLQHRILQLQYGNKCQFTVLADVNQGLYPEIHLHDEQYLKDLYPAAAVMPLTTSYRSTYEISSFAANILGKANVTNVYHRRGEAPQIVDTKNPAASVVEIIQKLPDQFNTVGILLSSTKAAKQFYSVLKD
ncbi:MAG: UvrD-helicase domain-containing protein, partial [Defluviitaleaceae bacterium]|nr:UvrD-helicase domain-containing protein [Defluviitaleaceae bacterium]